MIAAVEQHPNVRDVLNVVLYAFGKWGNIKGLRVDKDYVQLNRLFAADPWGISGGIAVWTGTFPLL